MRAIVRKPLWSIVRGIAMCGILTGSAGAAISNGDFESPATDPPNSYANPNIDDWGQSPGGSGVVHDEGSGGGASEVPSPPNGSDQWAYMLPDATIWQNIGVVDNCIYRFVYAVGDRTGHTCPATTISIWAGGTGPTAGEGAVQLDTTSMSLPADNGGVLLNTNDLVVGGNTYSGQTLWVKFETGSFLGEAQTLLDDVSVTKIAYSSSINNGDFENPATSPPATPWDSNIDDWEQSPGGSGVVHDEASDGGASEVPSPPNGSDQWAYMVDDASIWQNVGYVEGRTYRFSFAVGDRTGHTCQSTTISIWAGGTGPTVGEGATQMDSEEVTLPSENGGVQENLVLLDGTEVYEGQVLWLKFETGSFMGESQVLLDNVSLATGVSGTLVLIQ